MLRLTGDGSLVVKDCQVQLDSPYGRPCQDEPEMYRGGRLVLQDMSEYDQNGVRVTPQCHGE
jgi:hypothetical protein